MAVSGLLWEFSVLFLISSLQYSAGQDANCDYNQNVVLGTTYYVYSPNYPNNYGPSKTCRWQATCPLNTNCRLTCPTINIPATTGCTGDRLLVSKTGDPALTGADKYCGKGSLDVISTSNKLSVGLVSTASSTGGTFSCTLTAQAATGGGTCACGWKKTTRIVGGQQTGINEFPMMAGLVDSSLKIVYCGSTIISDRFVLTAAHCLKNSVLANVGVLVGDHNVKIGTETTSAKIIKSAQFIIHPSYSSSGYDYDIGLVRTAETIVFSERIGPACLPFTQPSNTFVNSNVEVLGWGTTVFAGADSDFLRKVTLQVISQASCATSMGSVVNQRIMCTFASGKDACQHDSGGPVLYTNPSNGRLYVVGIIMGGYGCATNRPGLNTRVTEYLSWISTNTGASFCKI